MRSMWIVVSGTTLAALLLVGCGDDDGTAAPTTTVLATTTTTAATTSTTSSATTTSTATTSTTTPSTTSAVGAVPAAVTVLSAQRSAGSGELEVAWESVATASGYRIERAAAADGPFSVSADVDVQRGVATVEGGVTNVYTDAWSYHPTSTTGSAPPAAAGVQFHYIEVAATRTFFRVIAYNSAGDAPSSTTVCASPFGEPPC